MKEFKEINEKQEKLETEIDRRLSWEYTYDKAISMATRFTVTELKKSERNIIENDEAKPLFKAPIIQKPSFMEDKKDLSAAEKGTLVHYIMQKIDLNKVGSIKDIYSEIERMVQKEFISEEEGKFTNPHKILNFFKSDLGLRMLKSENCRREIPFLIEVQSTDIYKELPKDKYQHETVLLQGIIDCFFQEQEEYVLIDYKTDYVTKENLEDVKERYTTQLEHYAKAIEKITGKKVKEKYLYLFGVERKILV
jgi:ATP-dependent helicase/nuclease subunit A